MPWPNRPTVETAPVAVLIRTSLSPLPANTIASAPISPAGATVRPPSGPAGDSVLRCVTLAVAGSIVISSPPPGVSPISIVPFSARPSTSIGEPPGGAIGPTRRVVWGIEVELVQHLVACREQRERGGLRVGRSIDRDRGIDAGIDVVSAPAAAPGVTSNEQPATTNTTKPGRHTRRGLAPAPRAKQRSSTDRPAAKS